MENYNVNDVNPRYGIENRPNLLYIQFPFRENNGISDPVNNFKE
jgi:hypothetical protein